MKLSTNVMGFYQFFGMEKTIDIFARVGFAAIDFNLDLPEYIEKGQDPAFFKALRSFASQRGISFTQTHAPFASSFKDEEKTAQRFDELVCSLRQSGWLGADMVVVHPANHRKYRDENCWDEMLECNLQMYRRLAPYAKEAGVRIAIENIPGSVTDKPAGLIALLDALNDPVFTVCFDVGHAHMMGLDPAEFIRELGSRIGCTHIHDNNGSADGHTLPYYGTVNWESVMQALRDVAYPGTLSYEAGNFVKSLPAELRPGAAKFMAQVGIQLIGLFEA